jgi:LysM repeat protein
MKKFVSFVLVLVALLVSCPMTSNAQTVSNAGTYVVQEGDKGWNLAKKYYNDATIWQRIVDLNPFLQQPGRVFEKDGKIILLLKPGEELVGLEKLGVPPPTAVPIEKLVAPPAPLAQAEVAWTWGALFEKLGWGALTLILFLIALSGFIALYEAIKKKRELRQDPVTSGPPIVAGGVQPNETERLTRALQTAAVAEYVRMNPGVESHTVRVERIGPVEEGMISGEGMVGYADRARPRRIDPSQPGYRARFRFPDGREDNLMSLQGCMNPCYYGEGLSGFTFEPRQEVLPTPEPERPAPQAVPAPAFVARSIRTAAQAEGNTTVTIGDRVLVFERGVHLNVDEATGDIKMSGTTFEMTVKPKRVRAKSTRTTPQVATGTNDE